MQICSWFWNAFDIPYFFQGTASLLKTVAETKQEVVTPIVKTVIDTKKAIIESPIVKSVIEAKGPILKSVIEAKSSVVQNLPNAISPITDSLSEILKMGLCNFGCPIIGTEQCKLDHCPKIEAEEVTVSPRGLEIEEAADDSL